LLYIFAIEVPTGEREFALSQFDLGVELVKKYESTIPEKMWVTVPEKDAIGYLEVFRQSRTHQPIHY
jgi:hypothetical protein